MTRQENFGLGRGRLLGGAELTDQRSRVNHIMSEASERWFCAYTGATTRYIDAGVLDPGFDTVLPDDGRLHAGATVNVKWGRWNPGQRVGANGVGYPTLNLSTWKGAHRAKLYALVIGATTEDFDRYAWADGWATLREVLAAPIVTGQYRQPYHALGFDYLHPLDLLLPAYDDVPDSAL